MRALLTLVMAALLLSGCGAVATPGRSPSADPPAPSSAEVIGQGTVISNEDGPVMLCLGAVEESYPPRCSGPEIIGWQWSTVDGSESANGVTWGTYAVHGTWDGAAFTLTRPAIPLALYDPPANIDPRTDPANSGSGTHEQLEALQEEFYETNPTPLMSWIENGYLFVTVIYDDGTLQRAYDSRYGSGIVAVQSALQPVGN